MNRGKTKPTVLNIIIRNELQYLESQTWRELILSDSYFLKMRHKTKLSLKFNFKMPYKYIFCDHAWDIKILGKVHIPLKIVDVYINSESHFLFSSSIMQVISIYIPIFDVI